MSKSRKSLARKRRVHVMKLRAGIIIAVTAAILIGTATTQSVFAQGLKGSGQKHYKSVEIQSGDSLWSIAKEYMDKDESIQDYIDEIKEINSLKSDNIQDSDYLMVAYYDNSVL